MGSWAPDSLKFMKDSWSRVTEATDEQRAKSFLFQSLKSWIYKEEMPYVYSLSKGLSAGQAQSKVEKIKKYVFPTWLEVHLEDIFWAKKLFAEIQSWAEQSGTQFFSWSSLYRQFSLSTVSLSALQMFSP